MKINVHGGHNRHVPGIISYLDEVTEDRRIKNAVIEYLRKEGHTVYDCTESDARTQRGNLSGIVKKCNAHAVDMDVSIHINGSVKSKKDGKTKGVEVLIQSANSKAKTRTHDSGVSISSLNNAYYAKHWMQGRRVL